MKQVNIKEATPVIKDAARENAAVMLYALLSSINS